MPLCELTELQTYANRHVAFALTLACPLRCGHCIAEAGPGRRGDTMPLSDASFYAKQFATLHEHGVECVSFTGGEAVLASQQLRLMSDAGVRAGMTCGVVSSGYWATSEAAARARYAEFPAVDAWDISVDVFHAEFVPVSRVRTAYEVGYALGRQITLRVTHATPLDDADQRILNALEEFARPADVVFQPIRHIGRGQSLVRSSIERPTSWTRPCITQGILVAHDGYVAPCCSSLAQDRGQPFDLGNARQRPILDILDDFRAAPLLQLMRTLGFFEPLRWVAEAGLAGELPQPLPEDVCDLCAGLLLRPRIGAALIERAGAPENRLRLGVLASRVLGESGPLRRAVAELSAAAPDTPGLQDAHEFVERLGSAERANPPSEMRFSS